MVKKTCLYLILYACVYPLLCFGKAEIRHILRYDATILCVNGEVADVTVEECSLSQCLEWQIGIPGKIGGSLFAKTGAEELITSLSRYKSWTSSEIHLSGSSNLEKYEGRLVLFHTESGNVFYRLSTTAANMMTSQATLKVRVIIEELVSDKIEASVGAQKMSDNFKCFVGVLTE